MKKRVFRLLLIVPLLALLTSCRVNGVKSAPEVDLSGKWRMVKVLDVVVTPDMDSEISVSFSREDGSATFITGCNLISVKYHHSGNSLHLSEGISTKMACHDMRIEDGCLKAIPLVRTITQTSDTLCLCTDNLEKLIWLVR